MVLSSAGVFCFFLFLFFFPSFLPGLLGILSRVFGVGERVNWKAIGFWVAAEEEGEGEKGLGGGRAVAWDGAGDGRSWRVIANFVLRQS